jgi:hypothetical protein
LRGKWNLQEKLFFQVERAVKKNRAFEKGKALKGERILQIL